MSKSGSEWTVYNADGKKFVIYAAHFDGDITVAQRVKTVCLRKSDGKIEMIQNSGRRPFLIQINGF